MNEHQIRLRGGWRCHGLWDDPATARTVTLPIAWGPALPGPLRLVRQFGSPAINRTREQVILRLEEVPGLLAVRLNDRPVDPHGAEGDALEVGGLLPRNELVLEVDPARAATGGVGRPGWGHVALVVRPAEGAAPGRDGAAPAP